MTSYLLMSKSELERQRETLQNIYNDFKNKNLSLDMSRGKPCTAQLDISMGVLDEVTGKSDCSGSNGMDYRNYGLIDGIPEIKDIFADIMEVDAENVMVGGNSSLNMMFDTISCMVTHGISGCEPWMKQENVKFLCPVPGYDRHFSITEYFGIEMINVPFTNEGPDMDIVEKLVSNDESIKGIWCVPKYSNPQGITYSDETVKRFARLKPAAKDFRIFWDNAYAIHDLTDIPDRLLSIMHECKKYGNEDLPIIFTSTSKITFPGAGIAAMACSKNNMAVLKKRYSFQTIGYDKLNQLRHIRFFKSYNGVMDHMKRHKEILRPKFDCVLDRLNEELDGTGVASWTNPNGGYFVSVDVLKGCAKRVVELCSDAGVKLTGAGATYPYKKDKNDCNIRLAPTYPPISELEQAMSLFCVCVRLAAVEKLLAQ